jgi:ribosomal protein S27E
MPFVKVNKDEETTRNSYWSGVMCPRCGHNVIVLYAHSPDEAQCDRCDLVGKREYQNSMGFAWMVADLTIIKYEHIRLQAAYRQRKKARRRLQALAFLRSIAKDKERRAHFAILFGTSMKDPIEPCAAKAMVLDRCEDRAKKLLAKWVQS